MEYDSIFSFLKGKKKFKDIYSICIQFEKNIINKCFNSALMTGRVISELLIIQLALKDKNIRNNLLIKKESGWEIKQEISLDRVIKQCYKSKENLLDYEMKEVYFDIKKEGNLNAHGIDINNFDLDHCKKMHNLIYIIASDCFNQFYHMDIKEYEYNLDDVKIKKRFTSDEVFKFLNNIHENEINTNIFKEYIRSKKIFFTKNYFDELINEYRDKLTNKTDFELELKKYKWIDDSNFQILIDFFDSITKKEIFSRFLKISEDNLANILILLNNQPDYLTIKKIDEMLKNSDENNKNYFEHIKKLSDNFFTDSLNTIINELKNVLVEEEDEETKEIINKLKNYKTDFDDNGFTINQVDKNIFLDPQQDKAVKYQGKKPLIINAGPGSGKTRVITERVRFLVKEGINPNIKKGVDPSKILVITFTNEATNELKNRLKYETDLDINIVNQMKISTIHSFCRFLIKKYEPNIPFRYLNRHGERGLFINKYKEKLGFKGPYSIWGSDIANVSEKYDHYFNFGIKTDEFAKYISQKNKVTPQYLNFIKDYSKKTGGEFPSFHQISVKHHQNAHYYAKYQRIIESYPEYEKLLNEEKSCDDNHLLKKGYEILCREKTDYTHILIDEFQDTDYYLKKIIEKLQQNSESFTIVGDLDQSIYGFRGAVPQYFKKYIDDKENEYIELHTNYRSSRDIVEFNEEFIKCRRDVDKELKPIKQYSEPVYHLANVNDTEEFKNLIYIIKNLKKKNKIRYYSDVLVLFKSHFKINKFVEELKLYNIPYYIDNKKDFINQTEIKAILTLYWYLLDFDEYRLPYSLQIDGSMGNNFLNFYGFTDEIYDSSGFFKLSDETKTLLNNIQKEYENNVADEAKKLYKERNNQFKYFNYLNVFNQDIDFIKTVMKRVNKKNIIELNDEGLIELGIENVNDRRFFLKLKQLKSLMDSDNPYERPTTLKLFKEFITITNFYSENSLKNNDEAVRINKDISQLSNIIKDYESIMGNKDYYGLFNYLNNVLKAYNSASSELEDEMDKVHVRTIHNSKGLEYPVVIIGSLRKTYKKYNKKHGFPLILNEKDESDSNTIDRYPFQTPIRFLKRRPENYVLFNNGEEYRKIYVGATRAKEVLILSTIVEEPDFIKELKDSNVNFELITPYDFVEKVNKIESSKIINKRNLVPELNFEKIIKDYLFCPFRYRLFNELKLEIDVSDNNYIDMVAHNLLSNIHGQHLDKPILESEVNSKVDGSIKSHNISSYEESLQIIKNIKKYWSDTGSKFKILNYNVPVAFSFENCELYGNIDLIIQGSNENKISLVQFICTDKRMTQESSIFYQMLYHFYPYLLKEYDDFKDKTIEKIFVYSLSNNQTHTINYDESFEKQAMEFLEGITSEIINSEFPENTDSCHNCEYNNDFCKKK